MLLMPGVMMLLRELSPMVNRQVYFTMAFYEMLGKKNSENQASIFWLIFWYLFPSFYEVLLSLYFKF